eukprot:429501-Rhodomonas_salina.1
MDPTTCPQHKLGCDSTRSTSTRLLTAGFAETSLFGQMSAETCPFGEHPQSTFQHSPEVWAKAATLFTAFSSF